MGFFNRFLKKVEEVNKAEADISELESAFTLLSPLDEANDFWKEIAQNIIVNAVKATDNTVERAFILIDMGVQPSFHIFTKLMGI